MTHIDTLQANTVLVDRSLSVADAVKIIDGSTQISLVPQARSRCADAHARLETVISESRHVYGITTGFGPLANRLVNAEDAEHLQQNLVHHLATGIGRPYDWKAGRAIVLARLMSILQGVSGASDIAIDALVRLLNSRYSPVVPSRGTVGASGDLTPLAHMVLCFQGRGAFQTADGDRIDGSGALDMLGLKPLDLSRRDGLALVNGTSAMTGVALLNAHRVQAALTWGVAATAAMAETQNSRTEAWHPAFGTVRPHPMQQHVAALLCGHVADSLRVTRGALADRRLTGVGRVVEEHPGQDAYTLRCAPQVIGAVWDTANWHRDIVRVELNSATDNPIFPDSSEEIALHGGNFMGQHVGLASDALATAVTVLAGLAERQVARLTDEVLNRGLPAFLHRGIGGLNSGLMGAQVTATALVAEMRTVAGASIHSISTNGANQDVVSMGTIAARMLNDKLDMLSQVQAILALCIAQAMDILDDEDPKEGWSSNAESLRSLVRRHSPALTEDRPLGAEIEDLARTIQETLPS